MSLTANMAQRAYRAIRASMPERQVHVRHTESGTVYIGTRLTLDQEQEIRHGMGHEKADGGVRLDVSELTLPHPKAGDVIELKETPKGEFEKRLIVNVSYDDLRALMRLDYGEQYG